MLRTMRLVCWLALPVALLLVGPSSAADYQGTPEARQACAPDAMRLCSDFIPDVPKITTCMIAKYKELSEPCRLAMGDKPNGHKPKGRKHRRRKAYAHCGEQTHCG